MKALLVAFLCMVAVNADLYMQSPRGSNNRLNEANAQRNNGNRLFDSQNNNRGGYNVGERTQNSNSGSGTGLVNTPDSLYTHTDKTTQSQYPMVYYEQSILQIEWTSQHGCGGNAIDDPALQNCNMVIQLGCDNNNPDPAIAMTLRDGQSTTQVNTDGSTTDRGIHESPAYYEECSRRSRNKGLFLADQNLDGDTAKYTRQNPNDNRRGLECPEERDYYPYWLPTPFMDIAYLTDRLDFCNVAKDAAPGTKSYIESNSENTSPRYKCYSATRDATALSSTDVNTCADNGGNWQSHQWSGLPAPACLQAPWTRSNHLGNMRNDTQMANYNWTIPRFDQLTSAANNLITYGSSGDYVKCVLRMRYNISTNDYDPWTINATSNGATNSPVKDNGQIDIGADLQSLQMSMNTDQFGRTFQDRSHTFFIRKRPAALAPTTDATQWPKIFNFNVRGKRGNIVQTYPAHEYDFTPNRLNLVAQKDYIHIQWTGSNTHNNGGDGGDGQTGDAGEGTDGTDRHNFVQLMNMGENYPLPLDKFDATNIFANSKCYIFKTNAEIVDPTPAGSGVRASATNEDCAVHLATSGYFLSANSVTSTGNGGDDLSVTLDNAPPSLIGGILMQVNTPGTYPYACTRNNNFSNRSQKGILIVNAPPVIPPVTP